MANLKPQNEQQEAIIQAVLGVLQGVTIQIKYRWESDAFYSDVTKTKAFRFLEQFDWRVKPKALPLTPHIWSLLHSKWRYAAMDSDHKVWLYTHKPVLKETSWYLNSDDIEDGEMEESQIKLDITNINWKDSLSERP